MKTIPHFLTCWLGLSFGILCACQPQVPEDQGPKSKLYTNTFDNFLPDYFFDHGSWMGLRLAETHLGLAPPLLLSDSFGYTPTKPLLTLQGMEDSVPANYSLSNHHFPGRMVQIGTSEQARIRLDVVQAAGNVTLVQYQITNLLNRPQNIQLVPHLPPTFQSLPHSRIFLWEVTEDPFSVTEGIVPDIRHNLPGGKTATGYLLIDHVHEDALTYGVLSALITTEKAAQYMADNQARWEGFLAPYQHLPEERQMLAAKCIQTLINNYRYPAGEFQQGGAYPSYYESYFNGLWAWDSWKHAVALATFEPEWAKEQVRTMFDFQNEAGMVADVVYYDTTLDRHNWRNTTPPLAAWAVQAIGEATQDTAYVQDMLPLLLEYHQWWYAERDHDQNGLCEYGSTDGTRIAAAWESGMDNAVRFDQATMQANGPKAWSLDQESVDLNAYLYAERNYLAKLAHAVGQDSMAQALTGSSKDIQQRLQTTFWSEDSQYFFDYHMGTNELVEVMGPEAWTMLWSGAATPSQAEAVVQMILDSNRFNTPMPFPTLDASHPEFNPENGYWRGPVWLDQVYFAVVGMRRYGFEQEAQQMVNKLMSQGEGILVKGQPIRENYDPRTGAGLNAKHFSWSAAHLLLLLRDD
ncbi:MAG TPA: hypothetical protein DCR93_13950 [Cytophagales bacterium]|nr:hypothetical protein [Cytophagales bacterium]